MVQNIGVVSCQLCFTLMSMDGAVGVGEHWVSAVPWDKCHAMDWEFIAGMFELWFSN